MKQTRSQEGEAHRAREARPLTDANTLRELVSNISEGIYITRPDGTVFDANPALIEFLGVATLEELQQHKTRDFCANPGQWEEEHAILESEGAVRDFELDIRRADGTIRTVLDTCYRVNDPVTREPLLYGILIDITRRKEVEEQLKKLLVRDPLTGCFNRRFLEEMEKDLSDNPRPVGAIVVDVDRFKEYNDLHGHAAGDDVLIRLAKFLIREARSEDAVIRTGGDEFVVLLQGGGAESTSSVARRYAERAKLAAPISISLGWAVGKPGEPLQQTVQRADEELIHIRLAERRPSRRGLRAGDIEH